VVLKIGPRKASTNSRSSAWHSRPQAQSEVIHRNAVRGKPLLATSYRFSRTDPNNTTFLVCSVAYVPTASLEVARKLSTKSLQCIRFMGPTARILALVT
jgi:hypothetical protein